MTNNAANNHENATESTRASQWDINVEQMKGPHTSHWDLDFLPREDLEAAYSDADNSESVSSNAPGRDFRPRAIVGRMSIPTEARMSAGLSRTLNLVLYQVGWFALVISAAHDHSSLGAVVAACLLGVHFLLTSTPRSDLVVVTGSVAIGLLVDSTMIGVGAIQFDSPVTRSGMPPLWLSLMWAQFATTLHLSLRWLISRTTIAAVAGFLGGPLAFLGGEMLGAVTIEAPRPRSLLCLAAAWSIALPLLAGLERLVRFPFKEAAGYSIPDVASFLRTRNR